MIKTIWKKFKQNPLVCIKNIIYKAAIGPLKYSQGSDYDAARYWHDRFSKYGLKYKGAGDEGLSEEGNKKMYGEAAKIFTKLCQKENMDFRNMNVLEIGCGTGFYTELLRDLGVRKYTGLDITNALFSEHQKKFPGYKFVKNDITTDKIDGQYDLIIMIDVIEHIVKNSKLSFAMENVKNCLNDNGIFIITPIENTKKRHLFYLASWTLDDIKQKFTGYDFGELFPFRYSKILSIKKQ